MIDPHAGPTRAAWARQLTPDERAKQLADDERATTRDVRRACLTTLAGCIFWVAAGLAVMALGFHTRDLQRGQAAMLAGMILGESGLAVTLARFYLRGERDGWW